jgi:zinc ribbon protein
MHCTECGTEVRDPDPFCPNCGASSKTIGVKHQSDRSKRPGAFHRFCIGMLVIWTALWFGLTLAAVGAVTEGGRATDAGTALGLSLGLGFYAVLWFIPSVILAILAVATKPTPSVPWPRRSKAATTILALLAFVWPINSLKRTSKPVSGPANTRSTSGSAISGLPPGSTVAEWLGDQWREWEQISPMDDSDKEVGLSLPAQNEVQGWLRSGRPELTIRCEQKGKKTRVYVVTNVGYRDTGIAYSLSPVKIRLDNGRVLAQVWHGSDDHEALFAENAFQLAKQLAKSRTLLFEFTPFSANPVVARFELFALDNHIAKVASACGWKMDGTSQNTGRVP